MNQRMRVEQRSMEKLIELVRDFDTAMLVTETGDEEFRARPMVIADVTNEGEVWFVASLMSPKVDEITQDPRALVVLQSEGRYLSLSGTASVRRDPERLRKLWSDSVRGWFRDQSDPNLVLLRIQPTWGEYWDNSGPEAIRYAARAARESDVGAPLPEPADVEAHAKIRLE